MPQFALITSRLARLLEARLLRRRQLRGVIDVPFSRSLVMRCGEPLGATSAPVLPRLEQEPAASPIKAPSNRQHPSAIGSGAVISHSDVLPHTLYPESPKMLGRDKERLFPDCRQEEKGGSFLKYLAAKRPRWNGEVLFCFIFDGGKLGRYTGLPFKS